MVDQTWSNFKTHFSIEYNNLKEENRFGASQGGFHSSNVAIQFADSANITITNAFDNMTMSVTTDRYNMVAALTDKSQK